MALEIKKPTTYTGGTYWTSIANCYDQAGVGGDETTFGYQNINNDETPSIRFHTWGTKGQTYTATELKLKWKTSIQTGDDEFGIEYTKNGGGAWLPLLAIGFNRSTTYVTESISLDTNQDLTQVEVRINVDKLKGSDNCDLQISDIWTEGTYTGSTPISVSDTGTGADVLVSINVTVPVSDAGTGADIISIINSFILADSGSGAEAILLKLSRLISDAGSAVEAISIAKSIPILISDSGVGVEALNIAVAITIPETGTGVDSIAIDSGQTLIPVSDSGVGSDSLSIAVATVVNDAGVGADVLSLSISFSLSDAGVGVDAVIVSAGSTPITVSDSGVGADALVSINVQIPISDSGSAIDEINNILAQLSLIDSGVGTDDISVNALIAKLISDTGAGVDSIVTRLLETYGNIKTVLESLNIKSTIEEVDGINTVAESNDIKSVATDEV